MKKEIKFSLVYRDMWQSSGKYQPRADQLVRIAPLIIEMGCFSRVEQRRRVRTSQPTVWREPEQSRPGFHETFPRSRHTNSYARPWSEWSSNVSRSGRCAPVNV